jgi:hypothetical protein
MENDGKPVEELPVSGWRIEGTEITKKYPNK